ncbi:MAG: hypothetical protein QCI38_00720 [Candidatus Thermoplasmatota archaeon]|nr:hypothetical protein [Candidatus Thermoplasmatota archaeon]
MKMNRDRFKMAAEALGKEPGLDVLYELHKQGRATASSIAEATGLHTATAMKYLGAMAAAGLLETRTIQGKTREMIEYSLPGNRISLELDLEAWPSYKGEASISKMILDAIIDKVDRIYGTAIDPPPTGDPYDLFLVLEERYGRDAAEEMFLGATCNLEKEGVEIPLFISRFLQFLSKEVKA